MRNRIGMMRFGAVLAALAITATAVADMVVFDSTAGGFFKFEGTDGELKATFDYDSSTGELSLVLENTTTVPETGSITAFAFHRPDGFALSFDITGPEDNDAPWLVDGVTPPPSSIGEFNAIYTVDGTDYTGAGDGMTGIEDFDGAVSYLWTVTGAGFDDLSVMDFLPFNDKGYRAAFKMKGLGTDDGSDNLVVIPVPGAALLGVLGLSFTGWIRRRVG